MNNEELKLAFRCNHYQSMAYEDERPRHRCLLHKTYCKGPCDDIKTDEAGTAAIEFIEAWKLRDEL